MSHHLDTPLAREKGQLLIDDLYVFAGDRSTVFVMDVNSNITEPNVQRGFHPKGRYEFRLHFDGADFETLTYRISFGDVGSDGHQAVHLDVLSGKDARDDSSAGERLLEGRTGEVVSGPATRLWAGRIHDSFYVDLSLLGMVNSAVRNGTALDLSKWRAAQAVNNFAGTTVESIVVEVSHQHPQLRPGARIGVWGATKFPAETGGWRQINRAGHPMMWPIFRPDDTHFTNPANTRHPSEDFKAEGQHFGDLIAAAVAASGTSDDPPGYGQSVARELFPDVLSYVVGTPATYSFVARNGRSLADNAPEAMLSLVVCTAVPSGLKPAVSKQYRSAKFPFVVAA